MSNQDFDLSEVDRQNRVVSMEDAVRRMNAIAPTLAATSIDEDPDNAARALALSRSTGVPPKVIHTDLDSFEADHRAQLSAGIVRGNAQLAAYIRGNPLADIVSNDDYGNLDNFKHTVPHMGFLDDVFGEMAIKGILGAAQGIYEGAISEPPQEHYTEDGKLIQAPWKQFERADPVSRYLYGGVDISRRMMNAMAQGLVGGARGIVEAEAKAEGLEDTEIEQVLRDTETFIQEYFGRAGDRPQDSAAAHGEVLQRRALEPYQAFKDMSIVHQAYHDALHPWYMAGEEPPPGVHPNIDAAKAHVNAQFVEKLYENLAAAQTSLTRERDVEYAKKYFEEYYKASDVGIASDGVLGLYGDRVPAPDDGLLGWVPDLAAQLEAAKLGHDVHIPLGDWLAKIDPAVAETLKPDVRIWAGGITAREAAEPREYPPVVDSPLAQVRAAGGMEPLFSIGDRKLELKNLPTITEGFHEYQFVDGSGKPMGELTILPDPAKKELYVANINGLAGLYSNSFGPSLIRDLKKQLKAIYPDYEWITGHRVSGAREKAGTWDTEVAYPKVKLSADLLSDTDAFRQLLEMKGMEHFGQDVYAEVLTPKKLSPEMVEAGNIIAEEIERITGGRGDYGLVGRIAAANMPSVPIKGVYLPKTGAILVDLFNPNARGVAHHETIHLLRKQGVFSSEEWKVLSEAAADEDWFGKFRIEERYAHLDPGAKTEEAIADAFKHWVETREAPEAVKGIFEKLWALWENIKARFTEKGLDPNQIFEQVWSGELARREAESGEAGAPKFSIDDAREQLNQLRAQVLGLDARTKKHLDEQLQKRFDEDLAAAQKRAEKIQKRVQTKEWKEQEKAIRADVNETIRQRPDVMADLMIGAGEIGDQKLKQRIPLRADALTEEQKAALPKHYYSAEGIPPDAVAGLFGYQSGDAMLADLIKYHQDRGDMSPNEHLNKVIADETARQMAQKFGDLDANILRDAMDQALSETNLNVIAEEWQGAAMQAGQATIDKALVKAHALEVFAGMRQDKIDLVQILSKMDQLAKNAAKDLLNGDPTSAAIRLQWRYELSLHAAEAKKLAKEKAAFDRIAKQAAKREMSTVEPEYVNYIHDILRRVGKSKLSAQDIAAEIEGRGTGTLADFIFQKAKQHNVIDVYPELLNEAWSKPVEDMTVEEFRGVAKTLKSLMYRGREEQKIYRAGEAANYAKVKIKLLQGIQDAAGGKISATLEGEPIKQLLKSTYTAHLQMENILNRWDGFDPNGAWNQYVMRDLIDGANSADAQKKYYAEKLKALPKPEGLDKAIDNPLFRDMDKGVELPLTRKHLIGVMLNLGTGNGAKSNLAKLAGGYRVSPDAIIRWVDNHATKQDWDFVQGVWDILKELNGRTNTVYRNLTGVAPEPMAVFPVHTKFGTYEGGYYPIIFDREMEGGSKRLMGVDPLDQNNTFAQPRPAAGHTKTRTGYKDTPLALNMDQLPARMAQIIHDNELRPAIVNVSKVFFDKDIRSAIRKHFGVEYRDQFIDYLTAVAQGDRRTPVSDRALAKASEFIRQNTISTLVGLNPGTVLKHGPTAWVLSMKEVGAGRFLKAVNGLLRGDEKQGEKLWKFAIENSLELQRRDRNWEESLYGVTAGLVPGDRFTPWRQRIMEWSSKPVAMSDMISAVPTWLAEYERMQETGASHGDSVYAADRAVRRAHGSTAITNRTAIIRNSNPWFTAVYNFFSDVMNRQMETIWKAGVDAGKVKQEGWPAAKRAAQTMIGGMFAYSLAPAIIEHLVSGEGSEQDESWGMMAAKSVLRASAAGWVGVRDFTNWMLYGFDPQLGLAGTAMKNFGSAINDLKKDHPLRRDHRGRLLQDAGIMVGEAFGVLPAEVSHVVRWGHDVNEGLVHPKGPWEWLVGLRYGTSKGHSRTVEDYFKGKTRK